MGISRIGSLIKARRRSLGVSQHELAALAGISVNTLYQLERGQSNPTAVVLLRLAEVLGMELTLQVKQ